MRQEHGDAVSVRAAALRAPAEAELADGVPAGRAAQLAAVVVSKKRP